MDRFDKRKFSSFEKNEQLFLRHYNGYPYWQALRFRVCESIYGIPAESLSDKLKNPFSMFQTGAKACLLALKSIICWRTISRASVICFLDGGSANVFFKNWDFPKEVSHVDIRNTQSPSAINMRDKHLNTMMPFIMARAKYCFRKLFKTMRRDENEFRFLEGLESRMLELFGKSMSATQMEERIILNQLIEMESRRFFGRIFDLTACHAIVIVCYYQEQLCAAIRLAKERDIRVVELQHGVVFNHESYWFEDQSTINTAVPDYFISFGEGHIRGTKMLPSTLSLPLGFPFQERELDRLQKRIPDDRTVIIYPTSEDIFDKTINDFAIMAVEKGYRVLVKLHPHESANYKALYPILSANKTVSFINDQSKGIYYWLTSAKHHIMANTTVGLEALSVQGVNVYIAGFVHHEQLQLLIDYGMAQMFGSAGELLTQITESRTKHGDDLRSFLWRDNAAYNYQCFFKELKSQGWPLSKQFDDTYF